MRVCFIRICVVLLLSIPLVCTEATIENGGYNVLVAFSQNMPSQKGIELIGEIETSLQEASEILLGATGFRISKVTFDIPESWDVSRYNRTVEDSFNSDSVVADILIDNTSDTAFGKFPFAQQYGSCGIPGYQMIVPAPFFDSSNEFPKGISLAREWLKYRYGVFDENGYIGDILYPQYYQIPGGDGNAVHVTHCTNSEITYNFTNPDTDEECPSDNELIGKLNNYKCKIHINEENMTSSLMYFQESITTMTDICGRDDDHKHNSRSPNKQNVLCSGKSIWEVIQQSSDIKKVEAEKEYENAEIEFVFSKKAKPRVVVAWENTDILKSQGKIILNAIKKLTTDLPDGSKFLAFPFKDAPNKEYRLEELNDLRTRRSIASELKLDFDRQEEKLQSPVAKAISILKTAAENPDEPPGNVIIITGTQDSIIVVLLKDLHVCIKTFDGSSFPEKDKLESDLPCLKVLQIPMSDEPEAIYEKLIEAMENILPSKVQDKLTEMLKVEYIDQSRSMEVLVDDFTESVRFSIFTEKQSDNFKLTLNGKEKLYLKEESYASDVLVISYSQLQAGVYNFSYPNPNAQPTLVEVKKTSKAGKYLSGKIAVVDTTNTDDDNQMPVIIYAIVRFGSYPVQNAKVSAIIQKPDGEQDSLDLNDDGRGDPDITQNDGVYSRYFTNFSSAGEYTVTVSFSNKEFATIYGANEVAGFTSCCGSILDGGTTTLKAFTKVFENTFKAKGPRPDDGYKPSRITDLRISKVTDDEIILEWTAPGGEADSGTASRYAIKLFCGEDNTKECNISEVIQVLNKPPPLNYGKEHQLKIRIIDKTKTLSISIIAFNENNKRSESNIVTIFRPNETLPEITTKEPVIKSQAPITGTIIGWVIAGVLIIICILAVVIYFRRKQKEPELYNIEENKNDQKTKYTFEATDIRMKTAPVKKIESFPVLLYTHDQLKDYKNKENDQPLQKSNAPPKQWKSLDVISFMEKKGDRDTKSLGSSSTVNLEGDSNK